jgi:hypothetical protein
MAVNVPEGSASRGDGDRRGVERRRNERRAQERRTPPPPWRRPWALVAFGVVGALVVMLAWNRVTRELPVVEEEPLTMDPRADSPAVIVEPAAPAGGVEDARGPEGFERLMVGGEAAHGRIVRAELFCNAPSHFTIIQGHPVPRAVAGMIQDGRVPAAECKWGERSGGQSRPDLLLLIPPELADAFASAPVVDDNYVERRHLVAELEWIGRTETLALRTAGLMRSRGP